MKIILRQDVEHLGDAWEIVKVKPGYARNYLIPKGMALVATKENMGRFEKELVLLNKKKDQEKRKFEELAKVLENVSCTITVQVGEEDKMFGSVTAQDVADSLKEQGHEVDKRKIVLPDPIKSLGIYSVPIKLGMEVEATVKVWVVKE
jgi:large subunit ribosomal protein L9